MNLRRNIKGMLLFFAALFVVLSVYLVYIVSAYGTRWFTSPYNTRLNARKNSVIAGDILDRNGEVLATTDAEGDRVYADDRSLRRATSHVVGDSYGQTFGADTFFAKQLLGFDQSMAERVVQAFTGQARHGSDVRLTIDAALSDYAYRRLGEYDGAVVVMNYRTGEVLASVSRPDYDPKYVEEYLSGERELDESAMVNRVSAGQYTPGSVFKLVTLTAALRTLPGVTERVFQCDGPLAFDWDTGAYLPEVRISPEEDARFREESEGNTAGVSGEYRVLRDYNGEYHGEITLKQALAKSCNHVFAELAMEIGADQLARTARDLGVGDDFLFSDLVAYASAFEKAESDLDLAWSGVGQYHDIMTPLHMCMIAAAVGNGGAAMEPKLLLSVEDPSGVVTARMKSEAYDRRMFSESEIAVLREYMLAVVEDGTGRNARISGLDVAGKTGTAEVAEKPHAWFVGYIADAEHPLAVCVVLERGGSGGSNAAPVAGKVLKRAVELGY